MESNPNNRWIFDEAAGHVYQLMKNDSYPRYLRSDMYKEYLNGTKKKVRIIKTKLEARCVYGLRLIHPRTHIDISERDSWCDTI